MCINMSFRYTVQFLQNLTHREKGDNYSPSPVEKSCKLWTYKYVIAGAAEQLRKWLGLPEKVDERGGRGGGG